MFAQPMRLQGVISRLPAWFDYRINSSINPALINIAAPTTRENVTNVAKVDVIRRSIACLLAQPMRLAV